MAEVWLKALSWAKVGPGASTWESNCTALQARPWASQAANCRLKLAATEATFASTEWGSLRAMAALPPPAFNSSTTLAGLRASKFATGAGVALVGASLAAGALAAAGFGAVGLDAGAFGAAPAISAAAMRRVVVFQNMAERYQTSDFGASVAFGFRGVGPARWLSLSAVRGVAHGFRRRRGLPGAGPGGRARRQQERAAGARIHRRTVPALHPHAEATDKLPDPLR